MGLPILQHLQHHKMQELQKNGKVEELWVQHIRVQTQNGKVEQQKDLEIKQQPKNGPQEENMGQQVITYRSFGLWKKNYYQK